MPIRNTTILLVEDNPDDVLLTLRVLKKHNIGNQVLVVEDGAEALDYLFCQNKYAGRSPQDLPQLILLDIRIPKIDGIEVLRRLRADERTHDLPVVILTASEEEQKQIESYKKGANAFIRKPLDIQQFTGAVPQLGMSWVVVDEVSAV
jgi:two-component system response regulator